MFGQKEMTPGNRGDTRPPTHPAEVIPSPSPRAETVASPRAQKPEKNHTGQKWVADVSYHNLTNLFTTVAHTTLSQWTNIVLMVTLIFGGCCANVFALEAIIKQRPNSGPLITFAQFLLTALFTYPSFLSLAAGPRSFFLSRRYIPLESWLAYTAFFVTVNLLNNWAFAYKISVPLHIILRSGGPVASMVVGYLYGAKRYSGGQILAVVMLTSGVATSALADARAKGHSIDVGVDSNSTMSSTLAGFAILALAMVLSAFQGIYADRLYEKHGRNHWKEALFYSHMLSLPLFVPAFPRLLSQWRALLSSPPLFSETVTIPSVRSTDCDAPLNYDEAGPPCGMSVTNPVGVISHTLLIGLRESETLRPIFSGIPVQVAFLFMNALTQYWCIRGVHLLSAKSSSLTVTIVLNIRKLISLLLSIHLFGNTLSQGVLIGAVLVFFGGAMYGFEGARLKKTTVKKD